jgi:hypothetical protein
MMDDKLINILKLRQQLSRRATYDNQTAGMAPVLLHAL